MSRRSDRASQGKGLCLLSLDAGGTQNISQLKILAELMHRLNFDLAKDQKLLPCDVFDMIGGSGTGGFVTLLLVALGMNAEQALDELIEFSVDILEKQWVDAAARTTQLKGYVDRLVDKYLMSRDTHLIDPYGNVKGCKLVIPILHRGHIGQPCILRNFNTYQGEALNFTIAEAILATLASPPLFTATSISAGVSTSEYISGDLKFSNPIRTILFEACETLGEEARVACLLSIGSGQPGAISIPQNSNLETWNRFLEKAVKDSEQKAEEIESQMGHLGLYQRFSVSQGLELEKGSPGTNAGDIITHAAVYLASVTVSRKLTMCVDLLRLRDGVASLGQLTRSIGQSVIPPTLPPLTRTFVMRKKPWEFIEKVMFGTDDSGDVEGPRMLAVTGMGGCGKTQKIIKFLKVHRQRFELCLFVDGSSATNIRADIMRHIRSLDTAHSQKAFEECLLFLSHPSLAGQRVIVYDNVDDPQLDLAPLLPTGESCTIIITSRNRLLGNLCPGSHLELDVMSMDEAIELLLSSVGHPITITEQIRKEAGALAQALGYLPIALQQARSYMSHTKCSARAYLNRLIDGRDELLTEPAKFQLDMGAVSTYAAFETSFKKLSLYSQRFLRLLSYFHWSKFPLEVVILAAKYNFSEYRITYTEQGVDFHEGKAAVEAIFLRDGQWSIIHLDKMMIELQNYSLITSVPGVDTILVEMHPLTHGWVQSCIPQPDVVPYRYAAVLLLALGARNEYTPSAQYLTSHIIHLSALWNNLHINNAEAFAHILDSGGARQGELKLRERVLRELCSQAEPESSSVANSMWSLARSYGNLGRYKDAELLQRESHRLKTEMLGEWHSDTIRASDNLALTYRAMGRLKEAEMLQEEVLNVRKETLGERHLETIIASSNLAYTYYDLGRLQEAEVLQEEVLKVRKEILGERHPKTVDASNNLALTYRGLGRLKEAEGLQEEVLKVRKEILGERHPDTIGASNNLANIYARLGRLKEAEGLQEEVLKLRKEILGERHPDTISASSNLANTYYNLGRLKEAEGLQEEVLKLRKEILGERHPETMNAANNLALTYRDLGRQREAEGLQEEVLKLSKEILGERHPKAVDASNNLALTYRGLGRLKEAEGLQEEVLKLSKEILGERHPDTISASDNLANTYCNLGRLKEAEWLQEEVLKICKEQLGEQHPNTINASKSLANTYYTLGRLKEAEILEVRVLRFMKEIQGGCHLGTVQACRSLAATYYSLGRLKGAVELHEDVFRLRKKILGEHHPDTIAASNNLAFAYREQGRLEDAKALQRETLRMSEEILGNEHPTTLISMLTMAEIYESFGRKPKAFKLLDRAEPIIAERIGKDDWIYTQYRRITDRVLAMVDSSIHIAPPNVPETAAYTQDMRAPEPSESTPRCRKRKRRRLS